VSIYLYLTEANQEFKQDNELTLVICLCTAYKADGSWQTITFREYYRMVWTAAKAFIKVQCSCCNKTMNVVKCKLVASERISVRCEWCRF